MFKKKQQPRIVSQEVLDFRDFIKSGTWRIGFPVNGNTLYANRGKVTINCETGDVYLASMDGRNMSLDHQVLLDDVERSVILEDIRAKSLAMLRFAFEEAAADDIDPPIDETPE